MKTTNWQTKALTLFIAAVALWLTAACGNGDAPIYESDVPVYKRIMPISPCPDDINEDPGMENPSALPYEERLPYAEMVLEEHVIPRLDREGGPPWFSVDASRIKGRSLGDVVRSWDDEVIIRIAYFGTDAQLSQVPPENRIPHCFMGVPIHILTNLPSMQATGRDYQEPETEN